MNEQQKSDIKFLRAYELNLKINYLNAWKERIQRIMDNPEITETAVQKKDHERAISIIDKFIKSKNPEKIDEAYKLFITFDVEALTEPK